MNQKKNKKILIILIIITFVLIIIAGGVITYLVTDIFKSDKELFFKYISQIGDNKKGFISQELTDYLEKRSSAPYNNESKITFEVPEEYYNNTDVMNNFNITLSGQVDSANNKISQNISINYSDSVNFPLNFRQVSDTIGIQSKNIGNKFICMQTNNSVSDTGSQLQVNDFKNISDKLKEIENIEISEEQINQIFNKYKEVLDKNLSEDDFIKIQEGKQEGYKLSLEGGKLKSILVSLLEILKNDETTLNKINEYLKIQSNSSKIAVSDIDKLIRNIQNNSELDNKKIEIVVYKKGGNVSKLMISIDNKNSISIEKSSNGKNEELILSIVVDENPILTLTANFEGLSSKQNVKENYEINLFIPKNNTNDLLKYKYNIYNDINFTNETTIESFNNDNSIIIQDLESEQLYTFINSISDRISKINKQQMEKLNLSEDENPLLYCIPNPSMVITSSDIYNNANISFGESSKKMSEVEVTTFNQKFELYEEKNTSAQTVKGLLSIISVNNEDENNYRIKEINFNGQEYDATETNIAFIKEDIDLNKRYKVEFEKDENTGRIFRTIINEK